MKKSRVLSIGAAAVLISTTVVGVNQLAPNVSAAPAGPGFTITVTDLQFILQQIRIAEAHATREGASLGQIIPPTSLIGPGANDIPDPRLPWGLRQVDGRNNNLSEGASLWGGRSYTSTAGKSALGSADQPFPRLTAAFWRDAEEPADWVLNLGPAASDYSPQFRPSNVQDSQPRTVSNLISDQTSSNPAAVVAAGPSPTTDVDGSLQILNTAPNAGVAAPYNGMFVLFGQFFDHGLDLVGKTGRETVIVPLQPDDPLYQVGSPTNFMMASRTVLNGNGDGTNTTTPWIDQNQTYTSHPSHQVFLREYTLANGRPVSTGLLHDGTIAGNIANWADVKLQARTMLGIRLVDTDVFDVPLLLTDEYGRFLRGPNGMPQLVQQNGTVVEGNIANPISTTNAARTGHAFLDDIAHFAVPSGGKAPDADSVINTTPPASGFYDNELLDSHFITGDGRGNENIGLTAIHTVFHAEHNRLVNDIKSVITANAGSFAAADWRLASGAWNGERLFQAARFVNEMEYQHLVFGEFVRAFQPAIRPFAAYDPTLRPDITAEFAHAVYRFGHSQLNGMVDRKTAGGANIGMPLLDAFLSPQKFNDNGSGGTFTAAQAAGAVARGMTYQVANEIDEFVTDTLRNKLLGLPLDLGTLNMVRGRDTGTGSLNQVRRDLYASTQNASLAPYASWFDFGFALRHRASLVNFVAAYGTHSSILTATTMAAKRAAADKLVNLRPDSPPDRMEFMTGTANALTQVDWQNIGGIPITGVESIDLWIGGLAEARTPFGGMLGSTFDYIFTRQMENLQDGDRLYYLGRLAGLPLINEIETNFFSEIYMRNSDAEGLPANGFFYPAQTFNQSGPAPASIKVMPDNTWRYDPCDPTLTSCNPQHVVFNGTAGNDGQWSSGGDDTLRGNDGNDRLQGGMGNDFAIGGLGNDTIADSSGLDILMGGDGDDLITSGGPGADALLGGGGNDFFRGGTDATAMTGSRGNDYAIGSSGADAITGDDGSDWMDGSVGADGIVGDLVSPFGIDLGVPGDDVLVGGSGNDLLDGGGQVDISVAGLGQDTFIGGFGFDWQTYFDPDPATAKPAVADLGLLVPPPGNVLLGLQDGFDGVEALSGGNLDDTLRGDLRTTLTVVGTNLTDILNQTDIPKIDGLQRLLGAGVTRWRNGNILVGGRGSDLLEGMDGDDLLDGDAWLEVLLSVPAAAGVVGTVDPATGRTLVRNVGDIYQAVADGKLAIADITIVRRLNAGAYGGETDTAGFFGNLADYTITFPGNGVVVVQDNVGTDGTDTLRNIEQLRFADTTVSVPLPSVVRNVTTTSPTTTSMAVSFNPPGYTGGSTLVSYTVTPFTTATGTTQAATACTATAPATSCTLTGLTAFRPVYLEIVARASSSFGGVTATRSGTPTERIVAASGTAPSAPTGVGTSAPNTTTVRVTWAAASGNGSAVTGYTATAWDALTGGVSRFTCSTTGALTCDITGVTPGTLYYVDVVAQNIAGTGLPSSPRVATSTNSAPSAPQTVNVVGKDGAVDVTWQPSLNTGGNPILSYTARAFTTTNGTTQAGSCTVTMTIGTEPLACTISPLVNGRSVSIDVIATNSVGDGAPSAPRKSVTPAGSPSAPGAPVLTPQVGGLDLVWSAPTSTGGSAITSYTATVYTTADGTIVAGSCVTSTTSCSITGLSNLTPYWVSVVARNSAGLSSLPSTRSTATTLGPSAPGAPTMTSAVGAATTVALTWAPTTTGGSPITGYTVRAYSSNPTGIVPRPTPIGACTTTGALTCTVIGLSISTQYWFTVLATNVIGSSPESAVMSASTTGTSIPGAPTITGGVPGGGRMQINWTPPTSDGGSAISQYTVRAFTSDVSNTVVGTCTATGTGRSCVVRNLARLTTYFFTVQATNGVGPGPQSSPRWSGRTG